MVKANPSLLLRTGSLDLPKADMGAITKRFSPAIWADPDVVPYAARVSVWGRWFVVLVGAFEIAYRPGFWYPNDWGFVLLLATLVTLNGSVHFRLLTNRPVTWRWILLLSAMDIALATASIAIGPGFDSFVFVTYYPALALFVVVFTSLWLGLAWTTMTAAAYAIVSLTAGAGLDIDAGDEKVLVGRLAAMYALVLCVSLITGFERIRRQTAVDRERELQQERIEFSQAVHDTTAQTAYLISLGIHRARELVGKSDEELVAALDATAALSRSAMWELRRPIDAGHIFEGRELGRVLWSHCATFEKITRRPCRDVAVGERAPARHGDPSPSLLHSAQRADQCLRARPARQGRGQARLRGRPHPAVRVGRRRGPPRRLRRARPRLRRHADGR